LLFSIATFGVSEIASAAEMLGAQLAPLTSEAKSRLGAGALITQIVPGSQAAAAGMKPGEVVVRADGESVGAPDDLVRIVGAHAAGDTVNLLVVDTSHGYNARAVSITVPTGSSPTGTRSSDDGIYHGFDDFPAADDSVLVDDYVDDEEFDDGTDSSRNRTAPNAPKPVSPSAREPIPVQLMRSPFCRALAPAGWSIVDQDAQGSTLTLASADRRTKAAYGVMPVSGGAAQGYYGAQAQTPAGVALQVSSVLANTALRTTGVQNFMGAQVQTFRGAGVDGFVMFRAYPVPGDLYGGYALSMRIAIGPSREDEGIAGAVASTISCTTQFHPPAGGYSQVQPRSAQKATGTSARCHSGNCDDGDLAGTYNVQLGRGYVHSESGQNFIVDPATDYHQTGPDGPGYYVMVGNSLQKAEPGWSE
jgi:hypothetical protein